MNKKIEVTKYNSGLYKPTTYGKGTISYGLKVSESENFIEIMFLANPETTGDFAKKEPFEFIRQYSISKEAVTHLLNDLKAEFFENFPDSENYFNKIESLSVQYGDYTGLQVHTALWNYMTNQYFQEGIFNFIGIALHNLVNSIESRQQSAISCQLF
jgi:hypothetical protein